jgi:hypothetical protein
MTLNDNEVDDSEELLDVFSAVLPQSSHAPPQLSELELSTEVQEQRQQLQQPHHHLLFRPGSQQQQQLRQQEKRHHLLYPPGSQQQQQYEEQQKIKQRREYQQLQEKQRLEQQLAPVPQSQLDPSAAAADLQQRELAKQQQSKWASDLMKKQQVQQSPRQQQQEQQQQTEQQADPSSAIVPFQQQQLQKQRADRVAGLAPPLSIAAERFQSNNDYVTMAAVYQDDGNSNSDAGSNKSSKRRDSNGSNTVNPDIAAVRGTIRGPPGGGVDTALNDTVRRKFGADAEYSDLASMVSVKDGSDRTETRNKGMFASL